MNTLTKRINVERVIITSRKSLQEVLAKFDAAVGHPNIEEFWKRMGATTYELDSSHVPMLSQPKFVLDVIRAAAKSVGKS